MKTIYQAPTMKVVMLRAKNQLLANSIAVGEAYKKDELVLSRKAGFFDDEDEE